MADDHEYKGLVHLTTGHPKAFVHWVYDFDSKSFSKTEAPFEWPGDRVQFRGQTLEQPVLLDLAQIEPQRIWRNHEWTFVPLGNTLFRVRDALYAGEIEKQSDDGKTWINLGILCPGQAKIPIGFNDRIFVECSNRSAFVRDVPLQKQKLTIGMYDVNIQKFSAVDTGTKQVLDWARIGDDLVAAATDVVSRKSTLEIFDGRDLAHIRTEAALPENAGCWICYVDSSES